MNTAILSNAIATLLARETQALNAEFSYLEQQDAIKSALVSALIDLHGDYTVGNARALYQAVKPLGSERVEKLLSSRLYTRDSYATLGQLVVIKWEKGIIDFTKQAAATALAAFYDSENGLTCPTPAKGFTKAGNKTAAVDTAVNGKAYVEKPKAPKAELSANQKEAKKILSAIAQLKKSFSHEKDLLERINSLAEDLTKYADKLAESDNFDSDKAEAE